MVFCCGCIHPDPDNADLMSRLLPSYVLTNERLQHLRICVRGLPVTYEHQGVNAAIDALDASNQPLLPGALHTELNNLAEHTVIAKPVGHILELWQSPSRHWWVTFFIDATSYEGKQEGERERDRDGRMGEL